MTETSSPLEQLSITQADVLLADAVGRNFAATLEVAEGPETLTYASRFLGMTRQPRPTLWMELPHEPQTDRPVRLRIGGRMTAHFVWAKIMYQCDATVLETSAWLSLSGGQAVQAIKVSWPTEVFRIQRRHSYRYELPLSEQAAVLLWSKVAGLTMNDRNAFRGRLINLSIEGMCVRLDPRNESAFKVNDAVAASFPIDQQRTIAVEAVVRRIVPAPAGAGVDLGFEFTSLDLPPLGPRIKDMLARWISERQRRLLHAGRLIE